MSAEFVHSGTYSAQLAHQHHDTRPRYARSRDFRSRRPPRYRRHELNSSSSFDLFETDATLTLTLRNPFCDFTEDQICDVSDINLLFDQGDLVAGESAAAGTAFDLNGDDRIDGTDVDLWLKQAASFHGYDASFVDGDADGLLANFPVTRYVDITDFGHLSENFEPLGDGGFTNGPYWTQGNFDGDDDVDITDFNSLSRNFSPTGYFSTSSVPEPCSVLLCVSGLCIVIGIRS